MEPKVFRKTLTYFAALCFVVFLLMDFAFPGAWEVSSCIKYAALLACVTIAIVDGDNTLRAALLLTAACDYMLLFTSNYVPAVLAFACAQALHAHRHAKLAQLAVSRSLLPACAAALATGAITLFITRDHLFAASALYATLLLSALSFAVIAKIRSRCNPATASYVVVGMFLFLLCDVCVAASNLGIRQAAPLMWLFYLPSQWLLASSTHWAEEAS